MRLEDPSLFIRSGWIRPDDIPVYEDIGFTRFKLTERGIPSSELLKRVKAYSARSFDGNLADLLLPYGFREPARRSAWWFLKHFFKPWKIWPWKLKPVLDLARQQGMMFPKDSRPVKIHADRIPRDFLQQVSRRNCALGNCDDCGYCARVAGDVVEIDPDFREKSLERFREVEDKLRGGDLWNV
jgi:hypothetical protein